MPTVHPSKARRGNEVPIVLTAVQVDRFWQFVEESENGCWEWLGQIDKRHGYGFYRANGVNLRAHRVSYTLLLGAIPNALTIDHVCRNRRCVNPDHLEAVQNKENILRGESPTAENARKTHCKRGHEFTPENTVHYSKNGGKYVSRECRECRRLKGREGWARGDRKRGGKQTARFCIQCRAFTRRYRRLDDGKSKHVICWKCDEARGPRNG
jgi:hypothetical protein